MTAPVFTFFGFAMTPEQVAKWPDRLVLRDERDGRLVVRMRTEQYVGVPRGRR